MCSDKISFELVIADIKKHSQVIDGCSGKAKYAARNAIKHLEMAYSIRDIDPLMAIFRSICAEEEAATALICSLQAQGYRGAEKIRFHDHAHKHSVVVLIKSVVDWYDLMDRTVDLPFGRPVFSFVDVGERRAVGMALPLKGKGVAVNPQPPLHMVSKGEGSFEDELVERVLRFFDKEKCSAIRDEIKKRANIRNKIIYAADDGCPAIHGAVEGSIIRQSGNVGAILIALGLIDPWRQPKFPHAGIVEACISALLRIMYPQGSEGGRAT